VDRELEKALQNDLVIDITTTGRASGEPRTVEIWYHRIGGRYYITGWPGRRGWYANLLEDPRFVITFTRSSNLTLTAVAQPITEPALRRQIIDAVFEIEGGRAHGDIDEWVESSPIIEFVAADGVEREGTG